MISVIIPHYDTKSEWLVRSVGSILEQTFTDLEVLVIDDASPDEAWMEGLRSFRSDQRLRIWRCSKNVGHYRIKNKALRLAHGQFIAFQDADDWSWPERLECQMDYLKSRRADMVGCDFVYVTEHGMNIRPKKMVRNVNLWLSLRKRFVLLHPTTLARRELLEHLKGFDGTARVAADDDFLLRAHHLCRIRNVPQTLYSYRIHPRALTSDSTTGFASPMRGRYVQEMRQRDRERWWVRGLLSRATVEMLAARPNDMDFELEQISI